MKAFRVSPIFLSVIAGEAIAQVPPGQMDYGPLGATGVPVGGNLFLLILGLLIAVTAFYVIRKNRRFGGTAFALALSIGALTFWQQGGQLISNASAVLIATSLDNPNGGSVEILPYYHEYQNTSGVPLKIRQITEPQCPLNPARDAETANREAPPACQVGLTLNDGDFCSTNYCSLIIGE